MIDKKLYWNEALKGGTIIGLVEVGLTVVTTLLQQNELRGAGFMSFFTTVVFILLLYAFQRRMAAMSDRSEGFSFGRAWSFGLAMMLFAGIIEGAYQTFANNFFFPDSAEEQINAVLVIYQDFMRNEQFDMMEAMLRRMMFNPFYLVVVAIVNCLFRAALLGLATSAFAQRRADIFATPADQLNHTDSTTDDNKPEQQSSDSDSSHSDDNADRDKLNQ